MSKIGKSEGEPDALCVNCDSWSFESKGLGICLRIKQPTQSTDTCRKFFPDPKRWPDADHG